MKRIFTLLMLLPILLEAGPGWPQPIVVKSAMVAVDLLDKETEDAVFSAVLKYTIDDQGTPRLVQSTAAPITKNNPVEDQLYAFNVTGGLTKVSDGNATLEYEVTKTKDEEAPIILLAKKSVELMLVRRAMARHGEKVANSDHPFLLRIDVYHSDNDTWGKN
jgi:hypothetical protein